MSDKGGTDANIFISKGTRVVQLEIILLNIIIFIVTTFPLRSVFFIRRSIAEPESKNYCHVCNNIKSNPMKPTLIFKHSLHITSKNTSALNLLNLIHDIYTETLLIRMIY